MKKRESKKMQVISRPKSVCQSGNKFSNECLKHKTGSEIFKMLNLDFLNSDVAKGISDMEVSYVPDFGYKEIIKFGEMEKPNSGWKFFLDCVQKHPR
jgi:hypothetical protein